MQPVAPGDGVDAPPLAQPLYEVSPRWTDGWWVPGDLQLFPP